MLAPPISPAPEPSARASAPSADSSQAGARSRPTFREEVARTRERDATRARPAEREESARDVDEGAERVDDDHHVERAQDERVRERPEAESRSEHAKESSNAEGSSSETKAPAEPESSTSKLETPARSTTAKAGTTEPGAPPIFLGWLPFQPAALAAPTAQGVAADTATIDPTASTADATAAPALDATVAAAPAAPAASTSSATMPTATTNVAAPADVAPVAEMARNASSPHTPVPHAAEVSGAPTAAGAAIAEDVQQAAAPARMAPAEVPAFLGQLEVHVDAPQKSAVVELEPLDLGRLSVELSIEPGNGVRAEVRAERQEGYAAIDARLSELRNALVERGFASVSVQLSLGFAEHRPRHSPAQGGGRTPAVPGLRTLSNAEVRALAPARDGAIDVWA